VNNFRGESSNRPAGSLPPKPSSYGPSRSNGTESNSVMPIGRDSIRGGRGGHQIDRLSRSYPVGSASSYNSSSTQRSNYPNSDRTSSRYDNHGHTSNSGWASRGRGGSHLPSNGDGRNHYSAAGDQSRGPGQQRSEDSRESRTLSTTSSYQGRGDGAGTSRQASQSSSSLPAKPTIGSYRKDRNPSDSYANSASTRDPGARYESSSLMQFEVSTTSYSKSSSSTGHQSSAQPSTSKPSSYQRQRSPIPVSTAMDRPQPGGDKERQASPPRRGRETSVGRNGGDRTRSSSGTRSAYSSRSGSRSSSRSRSSRRSRSRSYSRSASSARSEGGDDSEEPPVRAKRLFTRVLTGLGMGAEDYRPPSSSNRGQQLDFSAWNNAASRAYSSLLQCFASLDLKEMELEATKKVADLLAKCCNLSSPISDDKKEETVNCLYDLCEGESDMVSRAPDSSA